MKSAISSNKGKTIAIALILMLAITSAAAILPAVGFYSGYVVENPTAAQISAAGLPTITTSAGLIVSPTLLGVGQKATVIMWINFLPPSEGVEATTAVTGGWKGYTITITKPDGTTDEHGALGV